MRRGARLDPFSARLLSIHQKTHTFDPPPHEEHEAQSVLEEEAELGEHAADDEPALDLAPVEAVNIGCAECGGMGASSPVAELRQEVSEMKARIAALEARIADLEEGDKVVYRNV
jgi:hypothetical protein